MLFIKKYKYLIAFLLAINLFVLYIFLNTEFNWAGWVFHASGDTSFLIVLPHLNVRLNKIVYLFLRKWFLDFLKFFNIARVYNICDSEEMFGAGIYVYFNFIWIGKLLNFFLNFLIYFYRFFNVILNLANYI